MRTHRGPLRGPRRIRGHSAGRAAKTCDGPPLCGGPPLSGYDEYIANNNKFIFGTRAAMAKTTAPSRSIRMPPSGDPKRKAPNQIMLQHGMRACSDLCRFGGDLKTNKETF